VLGVFGLGGGKTLELLDIDSSNFVGNTNNPGADGAKLASFFMVVQRTLRLTQTLIQIQPITIKKLPLKVRVTVIRLAH